MQKFYIPQGSGPFVEMGDHRGYIKVPSETTVGGFNLTDVHADANGGVPPHIHRREDEAFYILEGNFKFLIGEKTVMAGPGDTVVGPRDITHAWECVSSEGGRLLIFFTPGANMEAFALAASQQGSASAPVDPALMVAVAAQYGIEMLPLH